MKFYFAGSVRGGRDDAELYSRIIDQLKKHGSVLTEHIGDMTISEQGEARATREIFERDMDWVRGSDAIVAEVTQPSLGVGYEIGQAQALGKPVLALFRPQEGRRLSAMIEGNSYVTVRTYTDFEDVPPILEEFVKGVGS